MWFLAILEKKKNLTEIPKQGLSVWGFSNFPTTSYSPPGCCSWLLFLSWGLHLDCLSQQVHRLCVPLQIVQVYASVPLVTEVFLSPLPDSSIVTYKLEKLSKREMHHLADSKIRGANDAQVVVWGRTGQIAESSGYEPMDSLRSLA